ncbi:MAG: hypothetical protein HY259_00865 [Chloroflexi bacterium]|nr:hypothetical protein [Chloroflexota bacterium]
MDTLNCFYFALIGVGVLYAVSIFIFGELHDFSGALHLPGDFGGHGAPSLDHGEVRIPALSPITVASFVTAFGAFGIIGAQGFNLSSGASALAAGAGGFVVAAIAHFAFGYFLIAPQGSSEVTQQDIIGATAEVTMPIAAKGLGEVTLIAQGGRVTYPARSQDGVPLVRGATVVVVDMVGGVVLVRE